MVCSCFAACARPPESAAEQVESRSEALLSSAWQDVGPHPYTVTAPVTETMSGQVSALAVDLANDPTGNTVYVGSSSGGLWRSINGLSGAANFQIISDQTLSLAVGAVALDSQTNPPTIYIGSGAPDNSANFSAHVGDGVLISRDGGATWMRVGAADGGAHPFAQLGFSSMIVDPRQPSTLVASTGVGSDPNFPESATTQGYAAYPHVGIYRSADSGNTWTQVLATPITAAAGGAVTFNDVLFFHIDTIFEPQQGVYISGITNKGLFQSNDGATWSSYASLGLGVGLPPPAQMFRVSLASRNGRLWALVMTAIFTDPAFKLFQSNDHGASWTAVSSFNPPPPAFKGDLMYVAAPPNSNALLVATELLYRSSNIDDPTATFDIIEGALHGDQHAIAFVDATHWYAGDDGGAFMTSNSGDLWTSMNAELGTGEFHSAANDSAGGGAYAGGQQDVGSGYTPGGSSWQAALYADGLHAAADPVDPNGFFISNQFGSVNYIRVSGPGAGTPANVFSFPSGSTFDTPYEVMPSDPRLFGGVTPPAGLDLTAARFILSGGQNPILVAYDPATGLQMSTQLSSSVNNFVDFIAPVPGDPTRAYLTVGSTINNTPPALYRMTNISLAGGATVTPISGGPINATDRLGHLAVSPACSTAVYVTKLGFLDGQKVFKTVDGGVTWVNISGNLPNTPLHWLVVDPANPDFIYVGTSVGAFVARDGGVQGEQWQVLGTGLPRVPVTRLQFGPNRRLTAATFGRGVWTLDIGPPSAAPPPSAPPPAPTLTQAIRACGSTAIVNAGALVDSYTSCRAGYGGVNVGAHGDVVASGAVTVNGNGQIHGARRPNVSCSATAFPPPAGLTSAGDLNVNGPTVLPAGDYRFNNVNINSAGSLTGSGGMVRIWYSGGLNLQGTVSGASGLPNNLWFFGLPGSGAANLNSTTTLTGNIYAPMGNITVGTASVVFGSLFGRQVIMNSNTTLHFDQSLNRVRCCGIQ